MSKKLSPYDAAFEKLQFINTLNNAGIGERPVQFTSVTKAMKALSPNFKKIINKLTPEDMACLNKRIQQIL